jgi:uncharacterized protein (TIGR00369 family)
MSWATERLDALLKPGVVLPPVTETLQLGTIESWGEGWVKKLWTPTPALLNSDGSLFGGYLAALADQMHAFAAMTVVPDGSIFRTTNLAISYFKVGRSHPITLIGKVVVATKAMISTEVEFFKDETTLIAKSTAQQILMPFPV